MIYSASCKKEIEGLVIWRQRLSYAIYRYLSKPPGAAVGYLWARARRKKFPGCFYKLV